MSRLRHVPALLVSAALVACAALTYHRVFALGGLAPVVAVALSGV